MTWFVVYMANVAEKHLEKVKALLAHMHLLIQKAQYHGGNAGRVTVIWLLQVHLELECKLFGETPQLLFLDTPQWPAA